MKLRLRLGYAPVIGPVLRSWQRVPRRRELRDLSAYRRASKLHRELTRERYTIIAARYGRAIYSLAREVERQGIPGAIVDCGVWNGGSTVLMSVAAPSRDAWAFDSFEGMPAADPAVDGIEAADWEGYAQGSAQKAVEGFARYSDPARLHVVKGWFEDTLPAHAEDVGPIALLHVDADWYESVLLALETFYPHLVEGGYVAVDDYKVWPGAQRAVDDFRDRMGIETPLIASHYWRKPAASPLPSAHSL